MKNALDYLRKEYRAYLNMTPQDDITNSLRYGRYAAKKEMALELNLISFNDIEVMETEELTEYQNNLV